MKELNFKLGQIFLMNNHNIGKMNCFRKFDVK